MMNSMIIPDDTMLHIISRSQTEVPHGVTVILEFN